MCHINVHGATLMTEALRFLNIQIKQQAAMSVIDKQMFESNLSTTSIDNTDAHAQIQSLVHACYT